MVDREGVLVNLIEDPLDFRVIDAAANLAFPLENHLDNLFFPNVGREPPPRNENYYENTVPLYNIDEFKSHFRMSSQTMEVLIQDVGRVLEGQVQDFARAFEGEGNLIAIPKKVHFTVWMLSKPESFLAAGDRFNLSKSTGHNIFSQVINAISQLKNQHIVWPDFVKQHESSQIFQMRSHGFPGIIGAVDSTHIQIKQPINNAHDYYNRKGYHSVNVLGICDESGKFINVATGYPGRLHDSRVFRLSSIGQDLLGNPHQLIRSPDHHLIGDCAYPLSSYVMVPYQDNGHLTNIQVNYNRKLSSVRSIIERAFGRLKCKFRRLKLLESVDLNLMSHTIIATCVIHNMIIDSDGMSDDEYEENEDENIHENVHVNLEGNFKRTRIANMLPF